eukprot:jgi/Tetstr1/455240/TSEL_042087.t1
MATGLTDSLAGLPKNAGPRELYARFKVHKFLGKGSLGSMYLARALEDDAEYAVKEIDVKQLSDEEKDAAADEIYKLSSVQHPCCTPIYDVFVDNSAICIVMGYVPGSNLAGLVQQGARAGKLMQETLIWKYFIQACYGLRAYHYNGILHRNIKPSNMHATPNQHLLLHEPGMVELLRAGKSQATVTAPKYMAPELWEGQPFAFAADIWALGCVLYELCTYKVPFEARTVQELQLQVARGRFAPISAKYSPELAKVVYSLLAKDPSQRPNIEQILSSKVMTHYSSILGLEEVAYYSVHPRAAPAAAAAPEAGGAPTQ